MCFMKIVLMTMIKRFNIKNGGKYVMNNTVLRIECWLSSQMAQEVFL